MEILPLSIIDKLEVAHTTMMLDKFCDEWKDEIDNELRYLVNYINRYMERIQKDLITRTSFLKTTQTKILGTTSHDFSRVGGGNARYCGHYVDVSYYEYLMHQTNQHDDIKGYIKSLTGKITSRYKIWTSDGFLNKLAERLKLPENAYFMIRSKKADGGFLDFPEEPAITEYRNALMLVYRFSK
jgi:hypothetical protein